MKTTAKTKYFHEDQQGNQPSVHIEQPFGWWHRLVGYYRYWRLLHRSRKSLMSLNDAQLRDIGLSRHDLPYRDRRK